MANQPDAAAQQLDLEPPSDDVVAVHDGQVVCKLWSRGMLMSNRYDPLPVNGGTRVLGVVLEVRRQLRR